MGKFIDNAKTALLKSLIISGVLLLVLLVGYLAAEEALFHELWQLSVVLALMMIGLFIQQIKPIAYLPFLLLIWAVYPELRRLLDWSFGVYSETPLIAIAPICVSLTMLIPIVKGFRQMSKPVIGITFAALVIFSYGYLIGIVQYGALAATFDFINYLSPLLIVAYVNVSDFKDRDRQKLLRSFSYISVFVALYGIYQFFLIPQWDQFWMIHSEMQSIGHPEALKVRVFSTLNSPGPAGVFFAFSLAVMVMNKKWRAFGILGILIVAFGFLLTLVRSSWIGLAAMIIVYFIQAKSASKFKLLSMLIAIILIFQFVLPSLPGASAITSRFNSFSNLNEDTSYNDRLEFSTTIVELISANPIGNGLGSTGISAKFNDDAMQVFDNGFLNIFYTFGLPGGLLFLALLFYITKLALKKDKRNFEYHHLAFAAMAGTMFLLLSSNIFPGSGGVCVWFLLSMIFLKREKVNNENLLYHP